MPRRKDYHTSTVDGAAGFARMCAGLDNADLRESDERDAAMDARDPDLPREDEDECNCSDPCCDCAGRKRGHP